MKKFFVAYPNVPEQVGLVIEQAVVSYNSRFGVLVESWKASNIVGNFIPEVIVQQISNTTLVADITVLNQNVIYEIGYAIGQKRPLLLIRNESIDDQFPKIQDVGIFDTLGYKKYQNSEELYDILQKNESNQPYKGEVDLNLQAPVYLMQTQYQTDFSSRITSRIKKAKFYYRSFDPSETPRLSGHEAILQVAESYGVLVQLVPRESKGSIVHNLRAAFIAGLAAGIGVPYRILQYNFDPVSIDYRDKVDVYKKLTDIDEIIASFANDVIREIQEYFPEEKKLTPSFLEKLDMGASAAENEIRSLTRYYLRTDEFYKASKGEVQLVIGRKGTGKSAIFYQIVNKEKGSKKNIVLDLQPEGYQLVKLKEQLLERLEEGTFQHTIMTFWEYLLLLEVAHKILEVDKSRHLSLENLTEPYRQLEAAYKAENYLQQADFSERMTFLIERLNEKLTKFKTDEKITMSTPEITGFIHETNVRSLKAALAEYLKFKEKVWILFDNIDKGWPSNGLTQHDIIIIRSLIDASKNLKRFFEKSKVSLFPIIFLRSDVYHHLVLGTSDRQKESKVSLDWPDQDLLKRIIQLRIYASEEVADGEDDFDKLWRMISVSHYRGEDSFQFIVDRCLMRPRFLINFISHCKSFAVNLSHKQIQESDIEKGLKSYSSDILTDINLEIRDIMPQNDNVLSAFYLSPDRLNLSQLTDILKSHVGDEKQIKSLIEILLWYGFLGIYRNADETSYIYNVSYNIDLLKTIIKKDGESSLYIINPAFHPALDIRTDNM